MDFYNIIAVVENFWIYIVFKFAFQVELHNYSKFCDDVTSDPCLYSVGLFNNSPACDLLVIVQK